MKSIKINSHVGSDGLIQLNIPTDIKDADLEIELTIKNIASIDKENIQQEWSSDFFAKTAGAWKGKALERESQGEYDDRKELF